MRSRTKKRLSRRHACEGLCNNKSCLFIAARRQGLLGHIMSAEGYKPFACDLCSYTTSHKQDLPKHVRKRHRDEISADGSYAPMGIGAPRKRLSMPREFSKSVDRHEWQLLKMMVRDCVKHDIKRFPEDEYVRQLMTSNEDRQNIAACILRYIMKRRLLVDGIDDAGGCGPLVLRPHCVFKVSLDRQDNTLPHFDKVNALSNINIVPLGVNHRSNPVQKYGATLTRVVLAKATEPGGNIDKALERESKTWFRCVRTTWPRQNAAYASCTSVWHRRDALCKAQFASVRELFIYTLDLLREQDCRCAITGVWMQGRHATEQFNVFQMSLDAINPRKGHVRGNLRWVCMFLNSTNRDKDKKYVASDDSKYPTAWNKRVFVQYCQDPQQTRVHSQK